MSVQFQTLTDLGGLITNIPEDKIPDRNASDISDIDLSVYGFVQTRNGHDLFANQITEAGSCLRSFPFKKNYGTLRTIIMRQRDNGATAILEWLNPDNSATGDGKWETLVSGLTTGAVMGFAIANGDEGNKVNRLVFCNAIENVSTWNGATSLFVSDTANSITVSNIPLEGFTATGSLILNGVEYAYTGISTNTFTGVTPDPTATTNTAGDGVAQAADTSSLSSLAKGNILCTSQGKLFLSGELQNESKVHYSQTGNVTDFSVGSGGLGAGGTFDVIEKGGRITYMEPKGNNSVIIHKDDVIVAYSRTTDGTNAIETFETLAYSDDSGATNLKAGSILNNDSYFCTGREGLKQLSKSINDASLNINSITDVIIPSIQDYDFSDASVIFYPRKRAIYIACKSSSSVSANDKVITYYVKRGANGNYIGDLSIDNLSVADWFIYDRNLYFVSSLDQNSYSMYSRRSARGVGINHKWVSKEFTYGEPARGKEFNTLYIDGYIGDRTKMKITVLYGILGSNGSKSIVLSWNDSNYVSSQKISALGTDVLGTLALGSSSSDIQDSYSFSAPIHFDVNKSNRFRVKIETIYDDDTSPESYWAVTNLGLNPTLLGKDFNKQINSNS